ncbi:preprotein translocase subunit YajC [Oceanidesulfovibrio indonesiensis]|uniref:Sec translocon accessory complex subunit YajC n=1 Tax=Oceanidesulfovibrio indonesiensis TaxID=54767 RepID=A0A7M3MG99_9BACT|nr:preprotein translocase subunit YajC [Oceanidesulfovibrio indonesiensis]TVM18344.1 preprotein translocase subunit YajC [Oceanidesulfovibrio indonesiensis]
MFFDSIAHAMGQAPQGGQGGGNPLTAFAPLILMFVIFYFLLIRPQQKKAKEHKSMLANLKKGDYIITGGGMYGRIVAVDADVLHVELAKDLTIKVNRNFVSGLADNMKPAAKEPASDTEEK